MTENPTTTKTGVHTGGPATWARVFRLIFALVPTPAVRAMRKAVQIGPIEELVIVGRRSGHDRRVLIVLAKVGNLSYVGHPNGDRANWVRNLIAAGRARVITRTGATTVHAVLLPPGEERDIAIREHTSQQKALPTRLLYRAARTYVTTAGAFFRLEPETAEGDPLGALATATPDDVPPAVRP